MQNLPSFMSFPPSRPADCASETGPAVWPADFESRWHWFRLTVRRQERQSLSNWLTDCRHDPDDWQKQWFLAQLCAALPGPGAIAALEGLDLLASEPLVRMEVLRGWREQGEPGLVRLRAAIARPEERSWALDALAGSERPELLTLLLEGLESEESRWRAEAARALGHAEDPALAQRFQPLLTDATATVRRAAVEAIRHCPALTHPQKLPLLQIGLADPDPEVAREAAWALAQQHDWSSLGAAAATPGPARTAALATLATATDEAALGQLIGLAASDWPASLWTPLLASLGQSPFPEPISHWLVQWAEQCPCRRELIYCLGRLGAAAIARPLLERWLHENRHPGERLSLEQALRALEP